MHRVCLFGHFKTFSCLSSEEKLELGRESPKRVSGSVHL